MIQNNMTFCVLRQYACRELRLSLVKCVHLAPRLSICWFFGWLGALIASLFYLSRNPVSLCDTDAGVPVRKVSAANRHLNTKTLCHPLHFPQLASTVLLISSRHLLWLLCYGKQCAQ